MNAKLRSFGSEDFILDQFTLMPNYRFVVSSSDTIFVLEQGKVDLFAVSFQGRETEWALLQQNFETFQTYPSEFFPGPLQFLASFQEGEWLFPFPLNSPDLSFCVFAVAKEECVISRLSMHTLRQTLSRLPDLQAEMLKQMQTWIKRLSVIETEELTRSPFHTKLLSSHPEILLSESTWSEFFLYQAHFLRLLAIQQENQHKKEQQETQLRTQRDHHLLNQSIQELQTLLNPQASLARAPHHDVLFQACQIVGDQLGLKFTPSKTFLGKGIEDRLETLCLNSEIYYRRIRLTNLWWQTQTVPLVAFYKEEKQPIALLPHPSLGYQLIDPSTGTSLTVTEEVARQISPIGYMFYRQLPPTRLTLRNLFNFNIWHRSREWLTFLFLVLCGTLASLSFPILTRFLFDEVIPNRNEFLLFEVALGALLISLATLAFNFGRESILLRLESLSDHDLEMAIWQRLIALPMRFFRRHSLYDLFTFTTAIASIRQLLTSHVIEVILNAVFTILYFFMMFYYSWVLAMVGVAILTIEFLAIVIPLYFGVQYGRQLLDRQIQANNKMLEMVQALTKVRLAGAEARMFHRWEQTFAKMKKTNLKVLLLNLKSGVFNVFWSNTSTWILYLFVIFIVFSQQAGNTTNASFTLGSFMAFISVFGLFSQALMQLGGTLLHIVEIVPLWEKAKSFSQAELEETTAQLDPGVLKGEIRLDHVSFGYQAKMPPILQDVSLTIQPGESIAFVGLSGSGKTTLIRLILGFERTDQGSVYYDNKDLKGLNLQAVRRQLGVVLQSGNIFDGTILDNINSGRHYTLEEVKEALHLAGADSFLQELPMGIHTVLTNGGIALSGGQRQMILIARALVGKPKILILDEATSSLDNQKQKIVYDHLSRLPMTRLIVAQRLNTIQHVDRIYVIDNKRIVDQGTFSELAGKPGLFANLLAKQSIG